MYEFSPGNTVPITAGAEYVAESLNSVWETTLTAENVQQYLIDNGLPRRLKIDLYLKFIACTQVKTNLFILNTTQKIILVYTRTRGGELVISI